MEQELRKHFNFRLPPALIARVDRARGKATRTDFVEKAIMDKLAESERMGRYKCPSCDYLADSPTAICGVHGRKVQPVDRLAV